ncbi:hypothetical protein BG015_003095 [Linnemannia schmuckeri]|uniref:FAD-binding PCMH-type domain-containing protein n=1 Tax=Linnemannia schmuckeri TaxID=64567 RepID=A0A9P5RPM8_9FUNG|nr:hypothetical protein BG015_003095 [Linnemannia schmuckeri]
MQPCWPSAEIWSTFNATVKGRLIATFPVARTCSDPYYDPAACRDVREHYRDLPWRQSQPATAQYSNWESVTVMDNNKSQVIQGCFGYEGHQRHQPCHQGAVPLYTVKALNIADVQATVRFASTHNIRLTVKNTGHDLLGRSMAPNSISLWMHFMNKIDVVDGFVPEGASSLSQETTGENAIILEPGVLWRDAYVAADAKNRIVVGGAESTVGAAGGYCLGGGHSPLSPRHGLCVDNVLQYKIVTPDGELRVANAYQNQDLFWALRGGGPGFGVVVEAVYRTHPDLGNGVSYVTALIFAFNDEAKTQVVRELLARQLEWSEKGWSGTTYVDGSRISLMLSFLGLGGTVILGLDYGHRPSFLSTYNALSRLILDKLAGINRLVGSRLIPQSLFESPQSINTLAAAMNDIQENIEASGGGRGVGDFLGGLRRGYLVGLVAGGEVASAAGKNRSNETSVHPAWRKALTIIQVIVDWDTNDSDAHALYTQQLDIQQALTSSIGRLTHLTPGSGAYSNEADPNEPDWQQNFWGDNYQRLYDIKKRIDPEGLFVCRRCVGSEEWDEDMMCPS